MREITWDKASEVEESFKVEASDPNEYGTVAVYEVSAPSKVGSDYSKEDRSCCLFHLVFQNGNPNEQINGLIDEVVLAILIDRARNFANGPLSTRENSIALTHLEEALMWKRRRVVDRKNRGVLNTYNK